MGTKRIMALSCAVAARREGNGRLYDILGDGRSARRFGDTCERFWR